MKCNTCKKDYSPECDYNQGRCPHHPTLIEIPTWRQFLYVIIAPFVIGFWCITHPKQVWEQAKKDWNIK